MNYYLVECDKPDDKLRHYKNSRVADYSVQELNQRAGYIKYQTISDNDDSVRIRIRKGSHFEGVNLYR